MTEDKVSGKGATLWLKLSLASHTDPDPTNHNIVIVLEVNCISNRLAWTSYFTCTWGLAGLLYNSITKTNLSYNQSFSLFVTEATTLTTLWLKPAICFYSVILQVLNYKGNTYTYNVYIVGTKFNFHSLLSITTKHNIMVMTITTSSYPPYTSQYQQAFSARISIDFSWRSHTMYCRTVQLPRSSIQPFCASN